MSSRRSRRSRPHRPGCSRADVDNDRVRGNLQVGNRELPAGLGVEERRGPGVAIGRVDRPEVGGDVLAHLLGHLVHHRLGPGVILEEAGAAVGPQIERVIDLNRDRRDFALLQALQLQQSALPRISRREHEGSWCRFTVYAESSVRGSSPECNDCFRNATSMEPARRHTWKTVPVRWNFPAITSGDRGYAGCAGAERWLPRTNCASVSNCRERNASSDSSGTRGRGRAIGVRQRAPIAHQRSKRPGGRVEGSLASTTHLAGGKPFRPPIPHILSCCCRFDEQMGTDSALRPAACITSVSVFPEPQESDMNRYLLAAVTLALAVAPASACHRTTRRPWRTRSMCSMISPPSR